MLCLQIKSNSLSGTEYRSGLTDKQLGIQRWFASLTFLQDLNEWDGWGENIEDVHCDGNTCVRYELSAIVYTAAAVAHKMPAYQQVTEGIMYNAIVRMISSRVWQYIELFDDFKSQPSYPDPVAYKNIMYSGHLAQASTVLY